MDLFAYIDGLGLTPSDWMFVLCTIPAAWFAFVYIFLTRWWVDSLGWIVALYALAVAGMLFLILYAVFTGERIEEFWRLSFTAFLFIALCGKVVILHRERRNGKLERRQREKRPTTLTQKESS